MTKSKITAGQVRRLGELAKINVTPGEEENLREELAAVLDYFDVVDKVRGEPAAAQARAASALRPDEVRPSEPAGLLKGVPQRKGRLVRAPRVF